MKCNVMATNFVKKTLKKAHGTLVERLVEKAHIRESEIHNSRLEEHNSILSYYSEPKSPGLANPLPSTDPPQQNNGGIASYPTQWPAHPPVEHRGSIGKAPYPCNPPLDGMQQPSTNSRYSQPPLDPRYSQPPPDPRYSQPPTRVQDPRHSYQSYQPQHPVELAPTEHMIAELPSTNPRKG